MGWYGSFLLKMLKVERFVNQLMTSNCYIVFDDVTLRCIVIDPGSEKSQREIEFIEVHRLKLDYIIMTHEHTDHNWGVNTLREKYKSAKLVCSESCNKFVKKTSRFYFLFYYDDPDYRYEIESADIRISKQEDSIEWDGQQIHFLMTPGHSHGSMCVDIDNMLFSGDTIMSAKPYFNGRDSNEQEWKESVEKVLRGYNQSIIVYPGHGYQLTLEEWKDSRYGEINNN